MSQEQFWILLTRKIAGEASPEDLTELEQLMQQHPEWQFASQNLEDIWNSKPHVDISEEEEAYLLHLHRLQQKNIPFGKQLQPEEEAAVAELSSNSSRKRIRWLIAGLTVAASVAAFLFFNPFSGKSGASPAQLANINEISTRLGSKTRIQLPDGSVVWLNAGSKLTYDKDYNQEDRQVTLTGEGFFDVIKDPAKPFLVHTSTVDVRVLGTVFNVKAYPEDKATETSLIRGSLEVSIKSRPLDKIILASNEKLVVENKKDTVAAWKADEETDQPLMTLNQIKRNSRDSTINETQWTENKLVFDNEPFEDVAVKMGRWFAVDIEITDWALKQKRLTGTFERESVEQALEGLAYASTTPFIFKRSGNKIIIHR
ncbi:FecR domain-containing protein [Terrimonas sp. NA20]|uniref:FecR domain-containing protein n=1 Tax=Terrimonas ginsenosidimutans TaxID=2908004 RepID=A0ABS9KUA5_9BACT|nr:FecR domain-containing protein [Terrimonas ginsenosidimutans]MCG2615919.1 FecR domain-containing protein [Terrimonas ginsenosidimutans]